MNLLLQNPLILKLAPLFFGFAVFHSLIASEVELIFGIWTLLFFAIASYIVGLPGISEYFTSLHFSEAFFVGFMMLVSSTPWVVNATSKMLIVSSKIIKFSPSVVLYFNLLFVGTLLGSFISEPAAITIVTLIFSKYYGELFQKEKFAYTTLATCFVNISIGGTLTHFAAPPILMVAKTWGWNSFTVFSLIGWKALFICFINASIATLFLKETLKNHSLIYIKSEGASKILLKESILVTFFLLSVIALGNLQSWWVQKLIQSATTHTLFFGSTLLTALTDNAAITYLATLVPTLSNADKVAIVSGAVAGGGLTVLANAPNPIGYRILKPLFPQKMIHSLKLFKYACVFTLVALIIFIF